MSFSSVENDESADDAAFVTSGSDFANAVFVVLNAALENNNLDDADRLRDVVDRGLHWSQR